MVEPFLANPGIRRTGCRKSYATIQLIVLAPEPCLPMVRRAILICKSVGVSAVQPTELMDAVYNCPSLIQGWEVCDPERLRADLRAYDECWVGHLSRHTLLLEIFHAETQQPPVVEH